MQSMGSSTMKPRMVLPAGIFVWILTLSLTLSILSERLIWISPPPLGNFRFVCAFGIFLTFLLWWRQNLSTVRFSIPTLIFMSLTGLIILYENILFFNGNENESLSFQFYCILWIAGYYQLNNNYHSFIRRLVQLGIFAGIVGWLFWFLGPSNLLTIGIGSIERFWGQNVQLEVGGFRSYSIFGDHQTYSAFMQFVGTVIRADDLLHPNRRKRYLILLVMILSIPNFSTTGLLVFLLLFMTYLPKKAFLLSFGGIAFASQILLTIENAIIHSGSLKWRLIFLYRQIQGITWAPHPKAKFELVLGGLEGFTSDCFLASRCYSHGLIWGVLFVLYLASHFLVVGSGAKKPMAIIMLFIGVNIFTNGIPYTAMPLMIICPIYIGILMRRMKDSQMN